MPIVNAEDETFVSKEFRQSTVEDYRVLETLQPNNPVYLIPPEGKTEGDGLKKWKGTVKAKCRKLGQQRQMIYTADFGEAKVGGGQYKQVLRVMCTKNGTNGTNGKH